MNSKALSMILIAVMLASTALPATLAQKQEPLIGIKTINTIAPSHANLMVAPPKGIDFNPDKLDTAILDSHYVSELASRYGDLYRSVYSTTLGKDIGFNAVGLIVQVNSTAAERLLERVAEKYHAVIVKKWPEINAVLVALPADSSLVGKVAKEFSSLPEVKKVYLDKIAQPAMWDTTVMLGTDYLNNLGINGSGVLVAVLDTGVDPSHPAIPNPVYWRDFVNNQSTPYDDVGHGTHVTGTILGNGPSIFNTTTGMWHSVLVGNTGQFNYQRLANLTYEVNVTGYNGSNVTLDLRHLYILLDTSLSSDNVIFAANAYILVKFDNGNWSLVANFSGKNQTTPVEDKFNITVPANASSMYVSFIYEYLAFYGANGTLYLSHWDIDGWFIDYVKVYNASNASDILLYDDVNSIYGPLPPYVVNATWWIRTPSSFHGVAPGATLASGKVCSLGGCPTSAILNGMEWAYNISADVVSMSLGGTAYYYDLLAQMADWLVEHGTLVVIAAGNSGPDFYTVESPGISHLALTVGAATKAWTTAYFSSAGPSPVDYIVKPDVSAPGMAVSSSVPLALGLWAPDFPYEAWAGTSMATPHVSGLAALVKSANPSWSPLMIKSAIISTADWLLPSVYFPRVDVYRQGAGMIDPIQAVSTTVLPFPANAFLGTPTKEIDNETATNITIYNVGSTPVNVTVIDMDLYWTNANLSNLQYQDWTQAITSPTLNESFVIASNNSAVVPITIDLTNLSMPAGVYGGYIEFSTNTSGIIKVIFGFKLNALTWINGTVIDVDTGQPLEGVNVSIWTPYLDTLYAWQLTNASGNFAIKVIGNTTVRIVAEGNLSEYYLYMGYPVDTDDGLVVNISLKERVTPGSVLIFPDMYASPNVTSSIEAFKNASEELGFNVLVWNPAVLGTVYGPVLSGDFAAVIYLSGGYYYPVSDAADYTALILYSMYFPGLIVLSGGDIGWFHYNDDLMQKVAHAVFVDDLLPGSYNVTLLKNELTSTLFGPDNYLMYENTTTGTPIGNVTTIYMGDYWPDMVSPVNNGTSAAVWAFNTSTSSIVLYYGNGSELAKSVYFAFDFEELPQSLQSEFAKRVLAFAFDTAPPTVSADKIPVSYSNGMITVNASNAFSEDTGIAFYLLKVYDENGTLLYETGDYSGVFQVDPSVLGLQAGSDYIFQVIGVDLVGNETAVNIPVRYHPYASGGGAYFTSNTTVNVSGVANGATITANVTAPVLVQLVAFTGGNSFTNQLGVVPPSGLYNYNLYMDLYANASVSGALKQLTITIHLNKKLVRAGTAELYWWNGSQWLPVSDYTTNKTAGTVTITISNTTSPSVSDLSGTPLIFTAIPNLVGGKLAVDAGSPAAATIAMALGLVVAVAGVLFLSRRSH